ncbi:hypothetical protein SLA2020_069320 [Shorea laevis]
MAAIYCQKFLGMPRISLRNEILPEPNPSFFRKPFYFLCSSIKFGSIALPFLKKKEIHVISPHIASPGFTVELLSARDDEYNGVIIDPEGLPSSANAFASALCASLSNWKMKGKKGIWLEIPTELADLVPIAIQEGFKYHHAEPEYVMLTYWIPSEPCLLPASPSHQIGVTAFVINDKREVLVVKEKCPCSCSAMWKLPTGYIDKSEDIFSGAVREVKEETGIDTIFLEMVAFRHAHLVSFEKSDLLFVCLLKPLSSAIAIDAKEIQAAQWMGLDEFMGEAYFHEDHMWRKITEVCTAAFEDRYHGFTAQQLNSKLEGRLSYIYCEGSDIVLC